MKQIWKKLGSVFLALCMVLTLLPTVAFAADASVSITGKTVSESILAIQDAIDAASSGDTVTVTGTITNAAAQLPLSISEGVTVVWKASITTASTFDNSLIHVSGDGVFEVAQGGAIATTKGLAISSSAGHVTVSGGTVRTDSGKAISGNVTVSGGTVSSGTGTSIDVRGSCTAIVSGGTVSTGTGTAIGGIINVGVPVITIDGTGKVQATGNFGIAINAGKASLQVKDSAMVSAVSGYAISTDGGDTNISGGTVSSGTNCAIYNEGSGDVTVSGGTVSNSATGDTIPVIYMNDKDFLPNIVVSGTGKVLAQGKGGTGTAIRTYSDVTVQDSAQVSATTGYGIYTEGKKSTVTVSGGTVSATTGNAIYAEGASSTVAVSGGAVFAYGNAITGENQVIYQPNVTTGGFTEPTGDGAAIAWNKDAGTTTYIYGDGVENGNLTVLPSGATVNWAKQNDQSGISYTSGTNTGFFGVDSVTVSKIALMIDEQDYQVASGYAHAYSFDLTTLLPPIVDADQVTFSYVSHTNDRNIFSDTPSVSGTMLTLPVASVAAGLTDKVIIGLTSDVYGIPDVTINVITAAKASVTITVDMADGVYNGQPYAYSNAVVMANPDKSDVTDSVTLESSYVGVDGTSYGPSATAPKNAGSYQLTLSVPDTDATYIGSAVYPFTIAKRPVTVKADNKSVTVGSDPVFTYTVDGQLSGETALIGEPHLAFAEGNATKAGSYTIDVFLSGVSYTDNYMAADPAYENGTLTVSNPSSGGNTPSGGGSSTPATPAPTVSGSTATTTVTAQTSTNGKATASVTQSQMSTAITAAQKAAKSTGKGPKVEIQVSGGSGASAVETTLQKAAVQALVTGKMESMTLSSPVAGMTFDAKAIATIASVASGGVAFTISNVKNSTLSSAAQQVVGDRPVYNLSVTSGGSTISQFDGTVTVSLPYTPAAGEDTNAIVIYYINANGEPELMQNCRYDAKTGTLMFTTTHFSTYAVGYNKVAFSDVAENAWCCDAVTFLAARGITGGTTEATFSPNATLNRGQFITLVMRAYGIEPDDPSADNFSDAGDTYYTGYLAAAKRLGITNGVGGNKFAPKQAITRQEMFTLLYNALKVLDKLPDGDSGSTLSDFADSANISSYAQEAMAYLVETGVVGGSNGQLSPTATTTRAQMAQVLYNLLAM